MRTIIIAAGEPGGAEAGPQRWLRDGDRIIAADGGTARALAWGLLPHLVIGDLDSLPDADRERLAALGCRFLVHPQAKDETDLELALAHAAGEGADELVVLGALGGRLDHSLANVLLLTLPGLAGCRVRIVDGEEEAFLVRGGGAAAVCGRPGDRVSLLPLGGDARGVTASGLAWPLRGETLRFGHSRGVSNEMLSSQAEVTVEEGLLLVVHGPPEGHRAPEPAGGRPSERKEVR